MTNLGDMLREAREARGLSWEEVERATHIRLKYLEALENNRFQELPGDVYTRGFLRNYSIFLELPYADVIAAYEATLNPTAKRALRPAVATAAGSAPAPRADVAPRSIESGARPMRPSRPEAGIRIQPVSPEPVNTRLRYAPSCTVVSGLALVVLIASYLLYSTFTSSQKALPTPTLQPATPTTLVALLPTVMISQTPVWTPLPTPGPRPIPTQPPPPTAPPGSTPPAASPAAGTPPVAAVPGTPGGTPAATATVVSSTITVEISIPRAVWFRVFVDDIKAFEGTLQPNTVRSWTGFRTVQIRTGRADIVRIKVNGQERGLLGSPQQTVVTKQWDVNGNETIIK
jgi:transcriptional regulator with XRE-family HTH domain